MSLWMITGSSTDDGAPIYLQADGCWSRRVVDGEVLDDDERRDERLALARSGERQVCDPYPIEVLRGADGEPRPRSLKQRIRAQGPTVPLVADRPRPGSRLEGPAARSA